MWKLFLKLLFSISSTADDNRNILNQLWKVQLAHTCYLQEHDALLIQGQFNPEVLRHFRSMQKNTLGFIPDTQSLLEKATTVSAVSVKKQKVTTVSVTSVKK